MLLRLLAWLPVVCSISATNAVVPIMRSGEVLRSSDLEIDIGPEASMSLSESYAKLHDVIGDRHASKMTQTDGISIKQSNSVDSKVPEYTISASGEMRQVARRFDVVNMLKSSNGSLNNGFVTMDASHLKSDFVPAFHQLEAVILQTGMWNHTTADGNLFEDGQGITTALYDRFVVPGTTVCETGFGGGHGALYSLLTCSDCHIYIFDNKGHPYAEAVASYLEREYPGRLTVTWGDSNHTMPAFKTAHPDVTCGFVMIDGGRSYDMAKADTVNFANMVTSALTPVLQHDCPIAGRTDAQNGICRGWHELAQKGCVHIQQPELNTVSVGHLDKDTCSHAL